MNKNELQKYIDALNGLRIYCNEPDSDGLMEISVPIDFGGFDGGTIETETPDSLIKDLQELYEQFDLNDYVCEFLFAKQHGLKGVPDVEGLVQDGKQIEETFYDAWQAAIRVRDEVESQKENPKPKKFKYTIDAELFIEDEIEADSEEDAKRLAIERVLQDIAENGLEPFLKFDVLFDE